MQASTRTSTKYSVSFRVIADPLLADSSLEPSDKLVLLALQKWGWKNQKCWSSNAAIVDSAGISLRTVQRALERLERHEPPLIRVEADSDPSNPTGRMIHLLWMNNPDLHPQPIREEVNDTSPRAILASSLCHNDTPAHVTVAPELAKNSEPAIITPRSDDRVSSFGRNVIPDGAEAPVSDEPDHLDEETRGLRKQVFDCLGKLASRRGGRRGLKGMPLRFGELMAKILADRDSRDNYIGLGWRVAKGNCDPGDVRTAIDRTLERIHYPDDPLDNIGSYFERTLQQIEADKEHRIIERDLKQRSEYPPAYYGPYDDETWTDLKASG